MKKSGTDRYFLRENGVPYINWKKVRAEGATHPARRTERYYTSLIKRWLALFPAAFGGTFTLLESPDVLYYTYFEPDVARERFQIICEIRAKLIEVLGDIVPKEYVGKNLILEFGTLEDYYRYIAHYYPKPTNKKKAVFPSSAGVMLSGGYMHIALSHFARRSLSSIVSHELSHVWLAYYRPPSWLNEGIATNVESMFGASRLLWEMPQYRSLVDEPFSTWTKKMFKSFVSGRMTGRYKYQHTFYQTAFVVVHNILDSRIDLPRSIGGNQERPGCS
jgi:hypothetical protein